MLIPNYSVPFPGFLRTTVLRSGLLLHFVWAGLGLCNLPQATQVGWGIKLLITARYSISLTYWLKHFSYNNMYVLLCSDIAVQDYNTVCTMS